LWGVAAQKKHTPQLIEKIPILPAQNQPAERDAFRLLILEACLRKSDFEAGFF
jgi:hypothetical protein